MKTLYLVRHAKSSWDYPELDDVDRPLNKRGQKDAPEMGRRLKQQGILPDLMVTSPANRALSTCHIIAEALGYPAEKILINEDLYHSGESSLLKVVRDTADVTLSLMIFGHNPGLTAFADKLANVPLDNISTCGIFSCSFDISSWQEVDFGQGTFLFYDFPKKKSLA